MGEDIPILNMLVPKEVTHDNGRITGVLFEKVKAEYDAKGRRSLIPSGEPDQHFECDDVLMAIGQENAFPWIEADAGIEFDKWGLPKLNEQTFQSSEPRVFFGGDAAFGPKNIIWAVAHGHAAAISIHNQCQGVPLTERPKDGMNLISQKMGIHQWSYSNDYNPAKRAKMQHVDLVERFKRLNIEVELGFSAEQTAREVERCLNCDMQTVFIDRLCIECDACVDVCPLGCLTIAPDGEESEVRGRLTVPAQNPKQDVFASGPLVQTARIMFKDEDLCVHCGLCAERCPTAAWDMQKFELLLPYAGRSPCSNQPK
jgi:ferredoxin